MEKIKQTDGRMPHIINRYACNFRCLLAIPEVFFGAILSAEEILYAYISMINRAPPAMDKACTVRWPDPIINQAIDLLGFGEEYRGFQVGRKERGKEFWWSWGKQQKRFDYSILKGITKNHNDHFRLGDSERKLIWDPADDIEVVEEEMAIYYQVRKIV